MPLLEIALGLQAAGGIASAIGSASRPDPNKEHQRRIREALEYLQNAFSGLEIQTKSQAERDMGQVRRIGARQSAALGYTGGAAPFTSPGEASIASRLDNALQSLRSNRAGAMANLKSSGVDAPIYSKPTAMEYFGSILTAGGDILGKPTPADPNATAYSAFDDFRARMAAGTAMGGTLAGNQTSQTALGDSFKSFEDFRSRMAGQNTLDGTLNRIGDLGAPVAKSSIASNYFTFGTPSRPTTIASPLYFGSN